MSLAVSIVSEAIRIEAAPGSRNASSAFGSPAISFSVPPVERDVRIDVDGAAGVEVERADAMSSEPARMALLTKMSVLACSSTSVPPLSAASMELAVTVTSLPGLSPKPSEPS